MKLTSALAAPRLVAGFGTAALAGSFVDIEAYRTEASGTTTLNVTVTGYLVNIAAPGGSS